MSENVKHTKGPWIVRRAGFPTDGAFDFGIAGAIDGRSYCIAEAFGRVGDDVRPDAEANARLIAAAPDMLEALKHLVHWHDQLGPDDVAKATAAIAKATGASQ